MSELAPGAMPETQNSQDLRATWPTALKSFLLPVLIILTFRWAAFEPYVIPSGSMIPNLLIHDYILVNKFAYGLRIPFTYKYLFSWSQPQRGDIVVFRNVGAEDYFLVKRVIGLPGDTINYSSSGELKINDHVVETEDVAPEESARFLAKLSGPSQSNYLEHSDFKIESFLDPRATQSSSARHFIMRGKGDFARLEQQTIRVPEGHYFMMGDNRDHSSDSRVWGLLPFHNVLGRASFIWFSCDDDGSSSQDFCDPRTLRFKRIMTRIN